mmetsp:Transcript_25516/g.100801  ORF Transcript_25516/g.100801 Transcript_25516/m.100801 type:complete len:216 (+) Transcript_25516:1250-1897(+)
MLPGNLKLAILLVQKKEIIFPRLPERRLHHHVQIHVSVKVEVARRNVVVTSLQSYPCLPTNVLVPAVRLLEQEIVGTDVSPGTSSGDVQFELAVSVDVDLTSAACVLVTFAGVVGFRNFGQNVIGNPELKGAGPQVQFYPVEPHEQDINVPIIIGIQRIYPVGLRGLQPRVLADSVPSLAQIFVHNMFPGRSVRNPLIREKNVQISIKIHVNHCH